MSPPEVSVIVVNWNSREDLAACLDSLRTQTERSFEAIVVDNGSTDGSVEMLRRDYPEAVLLDTGENLGFAEGCNRGIDVARGKWLAMLNNDAIASADWLAELLAAARRGGERLGMVQSRIVFLQHPDRTNSTGVLMFADTTAYDRGFDAPVRDDEEDEEVFCPSAGAALYRRAMIDEVRLESGVFDRTFFMYFEDVDLGWRCRLAGWSAIYAPAAVVRHKFHGSASRRGNDFVALHCQRNRVRMLLKNGSPWRIVRGVPRTFVDVTWSLRRHGVGTLLAYGKAFADGWRQRPHVDKIRTERRQSVERQWTAKKKP